MIQVHNCDQGSEEWFKLRAGMPTASEFSTVMASGRGGGDSKTRRTYLLKLAGEILTGEPMERYSNAHMERGHDMEAEARERYAFETDSDPQLVGFVTNDAFGAGASPDSLVGDVGMLEIKTKLPHLHIEALLRNDFPPEHKAQCQGQLWVCEREWVDLSVYWPKLPPIVHRTYRDEVYLKELEAGVSAFNDELAEMVERVRRYGRPAAAEAA